MEKKKINHLELWEAVGKTDPRHTKKVKYGNREFTSINATYQAKVATEQWGKYGSAWGMQQTDYVIERLEEVILLVIHGTFVYPDGSFPISAAVKIKYTDKYGKVHVDDDAYKKVLTDATTKALSKLGFSADVFMGKWDDVKYVNERKEEVKLDNVSSALRKHIQMATTAEQLKRCEGKLTPEWKPAYDKKMKELLA